MLLLVRLEGMTPNLGEMYPDAQVKALNKKHLAGDSDDHGDHGGVSQAEIIADMPPALRQYILYNLETSHKAKVTAKRAAPAPGPAPASGSAPAPGPAPASGSAPARVSPPPTGTAAVGAVTPAPTPVTPPVTPAPTPVTPAPIPETPTPQPQ